MCYEGVFVEDSELKQTFAEPSPWGDWLKNESISMKNLLLALDSCMVSGPF